MKKKTKKYISYWMTVFIAVTTSYFIWLSWKKLTELIGNSNIIWLVTGGIVLFAIVFGIGHFSFKKLVEKFK